MKSIFSLTVLLALALPARAQLIGNLTDAPQHAFAVGGGFDPSTHEGSAFFGYAEKLTGATYSYSRAEFIPGYVTTTNPAPLGNSANLTTNETTTTKTFTIRPVVSTGIKQVIFQEGRLSLAVDGTAGAALPTTTAGAFNMAFSGSADVIWRLNKTLNSAPGQTNNYLVFGPSLVQLTGAPGGTTVAMRFAWLHGVNGQPVAASLKK